jgi:hypothetical protein
MSEPEPKRPIILDRSRLEQFATCPLQGYLNVIWDALKAQDNGEEVFWWEKEILDKANHKLIQAMQSKIKQSTTGSLAECGIEIHSLVEQAFEACENDVRMIPQWFVDNLPTIKPSFQPMAVRHARHIGDMIADYHVAVIGCELQISMVIIEETPEQPALIGTTRLDLLGSGKESLHVSDWKTGFKRRSNTEAHDSFQAQFIAALLFSLPEYKEVNTIHFWYMETMFGTKAYARFDRNEENPRLPGLTTELLLKSRVKEAAKIFLSNLKEPWPLPESCLWCSMIQFCDYASMDAKEIADDPKGFVDSLVVLDALCKKRKKAATAYIKGHGAIEGTKVVYDKKKPQERFTADFQDKAKPKGPAETGDNELDGHFK